MGSACSSPKQTSRSCLAVLLELSKPYRHTQSFRVPWRSNCLSERRSSSHQQPMIAPVGRKSRARSNRRFGTWLHNRDADNPVCASLAPTAQHHLEPGGNAAGFVKSQKASPPLRSSQTGLSASHRCVALQLSRQIGWDVRDNDGVVAFVAQFQDVADAVDLGDQGRFIRWNTKTRAQPPRTKRLLERLHKVVNSLSGARRYRDAPRKAFSVRLRQLAIRQIINLIENNHSLLPVSIQFLNDAIDRFHLLVYARMTKINNVNEQIGFAHFFERRLKRFD